MSTSLPLNDCLYAGPSLTSEISDVLMRFRYYEAALVADIEKAFLMHDPTSNDPNIAVKRFNRVVIGVTSCHFLLKETVRHHVSNYEAEDPRF